MIRGVLHWAARIAINRNKRVKIWENNMSKISRAQSIGTLANTLENCGHNLDIERPVPIAELGDEIKLLYMKVFIMLIASNNEDAPNIAKINLLMTRIECPPDVRKKIREFIGDNEFGDIIQALGSLINQLEPIDRKGIRFPLLKDMLQFYELNLLDLSATEKLNKVQSVPHISQALTVLDMNQEQTELLIDSYCFDQAILSGKMDDTQLEKMAKDLTAKASGVGVPLAVLYVSGTMGLSAAGITSALAWLGFGGILGLSSMVTGIGVLIVLGTGVYQGVKYISGANERNNLTKRELMLGLILQNHQNCIANMAEDIFDITASLKKLLIDAAKNQILINKIIERLSLLQDAANYIIQKEKETREEISSEGGRA